MWRKWRAALALAALMALGTGGYIAGPAPINDENPTPPVSFGQTWVNTTTRTTAVYDGSRAEWMGSPFVVYFDRSAAVSSEFLRVGGNGLISDTSGTLAGDISVGLAVPRRTRVLGVWGNAAKGFGTTPSGTLRVWTTVASANPATLKAKFAIDGSGFYSWPESTFVIEPGEVMAVSLNKDGATAITSPIFGFRFFEIDTIP